MHSWSVQPKPSRIRTAYRTVLIDIQASRQVNGHHEGLLLAEVKCFSDPDRSSIDLYIAIGQYLIYQTVLEERRISTPLYLAVPAKAFADIFDPIARRALEVYHVKLVIIDIDHERIAQWMLF